MGSFFLLNGATFPVSATLLIIAAAAACYVFLALLPIYYRNRGAAAQADPRAAVLRTAALLLLLVGVFLTAFTLGIRQVYGWGATWVLGLEAAAYFLAATLVLNRAGRRAARAPAGGSSP